MKILLVGECSNLHWTLSQGLKELGHDVTVVSDGSLWMNNPRDINLVRKSNTLSHTFKYLFDISKNLHRMKGYDIVQIKNPLFLKLKIEKNFLIYKFLKKFNKRVFLGGFGTDYFWMNACLQHTMFRYSEYFIGNNPTNYYLTTRGGELDWWSDKRRQINAEIADSCDGIIACLYEYFLPYFENYSNKLKYIPLPINTDEIKFKERNYSNRKINFFIGVQKGRNQLKGTDVMIHALNRIVADFPKEAELSVAESIPYSEYIQLMSNGDVLLDQLYSYTPGMNALAAMAYGLIAVSGGEPECYKILNENQIHPIINVLPSEEDVYMQLKKLILEKENLPLLSKQSRQFVEKHHDYRKVAQEYLDFWTR